MGNSQTRGRNQYGNDKPDGSGSRYTTDPKGGPSIIEPWMPGYYRPPKEAKQNAGAKPRNSGKNPFNKAVNALKGG